MRQDDRTGFRTAAALLCLLVLFFCAFSAHDNDTWWHLRAGELIWRGRAIPSSDPFSYTIAGQPWFSFEWLSELAYFAAWRLGGVAGVIALKSLAAAAAYGLMLASFPWVETALLLGLAAFCGEQVLLERPGVFDLTFLAGFVFLLRRGGRETRWGIPILAALWSNLHGGAAFLGFAVTAAACLDGEIPKGRRASLLGLTAAGLLVNPQGWRLLGHLWSTVSFAQRGAISEWRPLERMLSLEGVFIAAGALAACAQLRRRPGRSLLTLVLAAAAAGARRHAPLYALFAAPVLAAPAASLCRGRLRGRQLAPLFALLGWLWWDGVYLPWGRAFGFSSREDLSRAVAFLDSNLIGGRMFNEYDSGGALIGLGYPARRVFIDSRNVDYGPELVREALNWTRDWKALDAKYAFDYAVLFNRRTAYPCRALDEDLDWALAYWDDAALVYVKKADGGPPPLNLLRPNEPFFDWIDAAARGPKAADLAGELDRSITQCGRCTEALLARAYLHTLLKETGHAELLVKEASGQVLWKPELWSDLAQVQRALGQRQDAERSWSRAARAARQTDNHHLELLLTDRKPR